MWIWTILLLLVVQQAALGKMDNGGWSNDEPSVFVRTVGMHEKFYDHTAECVMITEYMYPCDSISPMWKHMRLPNQLGQTTYAEASSFMSSFGTDDMMSCERDAKMFLCSLVAPICFAEKVHVSILPCRSLCERVSANCMFQLDELGNGIPSKLNCSNFVDNNICMDPQRGRDADAAQADYDERADGLTTRSPSELKPLSGGDSELKPLSGREFTGENLETTGFRHGNYFTDVLRAFCYGNRIKLVIRGRLKLMKPKNKGTYMKVREQNLKVFYDPDHLLETNDNGETQHGLTLHGVPLDDYFFRSFLEIDAPVDDLAVKRDVVFMFISDVENITEEKGRFLRVQYLVTDNGEAGLRAVVNAARDVNVMTDCQSYMDNQED